MAWWPPDPVDGRAINVAGDFNGIICMKDPYETLGVNRSATDKEIKDAFKKLARKFHPDLHPGDKEAEGKFKDISAANDLLKDKEKRRRFDAGEIDASGVERPQERFYRDFADGRAHTSHATQDGFASNEELEEFLARAFSGGGRQSQGAFRARGQDVSYVLSVGFLEAATGATRTIALPEGKMLQVTIPGGAEDRQMLRLKGQGMPGFGGGPAGDAYVELHVDSHPFFNRKDDNIHVEVPVTLKEAVLGARIEVPTIGGPVAVTVPKGSNTGTTLRLRDRGIRNRKSEQRGHQMINLKVVLPATEESELVAFLETWQPKTQQDPRKEMST
jgi:DnaJ-class molecular chaperone